MKDISNLTVTQFRIFPSGAIPLHALRVKSRLQRLSEKFGFSNVGVAVAGEEIQAEAGIFQSTEHGALILDAVHINDRRTVVKVLGSSNAANEFHDALVNALQELTAPDPLVVPEPVFVTEETTCSVTLDLEVYELLAQPMRRLLEEQLVQRVSDEKVAAELAMIRLRAEFIYRPKTSELGQHKITLAPKNFVLEPKADTPLLARRYHTESPTNSDTHLELIGLFERELIANRS
jgi:hypothetical protein